MAPKYKVAVCQFDPKASLPLPHHEPSAHNFQVMDPESNFLTAKKHITDAASAGANLAVLPEFHLTSWQPHRAGFTDACDASTAYLPRYQALARELSINIVPGTICESAVDETNPDEVEWRNMAYFIAAGTGEIVGSYQKKNLWHTERGHLSSSHDDSHLAFDTKLPDGGTLRVGLLVCWDLAFPEAFRALVADGANMIIIPSWWYPLNENDEGSQFEKEGLKINADSEKIFVESTTISRAFEGGVAVVYCNAGGWSGVTMPVLGEVVRCGTGEEMKVVEIDLDVLRVAEGIYKIREDLRSVDWHYGYEKK